MMRFRNPHVDRWLMGIALSAVSLAFSACASTSVSRRPTDRPVRADASVGNRASLPSVANPSASSVENRGGLESKSAKTAELDRRLAQAVTPAETSAHIEAEILKTDADMEPVPVARKRGHLEIPIETNERVKEWIHYFTVRDRERFQRFIDRGATYRPAIAKILKDNDVPSDLYYLAMIESGFSLHARSHASAVGAWQFIRGTGDRYGLMQNAYVDERRDILHSTQAAATYLKRLHAAFQSWYLALAAYNSGEGRILSAILNGGSRDFWELVENKALPEETRHYVPKFLAAVIIGRNPSKYGFEVPRVRPHPEVEAVEVPGGVRLYDIASKSGVSYELLRQVNPHLIRAMTPPQVSNYSIWVPRADFAKVSFIRKDLPQMRIRVRTVASSQSTSRSSMKQKIVTTRSSRVTSSSSGSARFHRVKNGEGLSDIATRYNTSIGRLKRLNALSSSKIYAGQRLKLR